MHLGSLLAAVGSYLSVKQANGRWLLRIEDLDRNREIPGVAEQMLRILESFGFEWDGKVEFQKNRILFYEQALAHLDAKALCYACRCSRSQLASHATEPGEELVYPGTCRNDPDARQRPHALRFRTDARMPEIAFEDRLQGLVSEDCHRQAGDFVIRRRDGFFAYHLAVVVDDELQGVTEVVRGCDLLSCTPRQILLQQALGYRTPAYAHLPLLLEADGRKLAKSRHAVPLDADRAAPALWEVLAWLRQEPPAGLAGAPVREIWAWALPNWRPERLVGCRELRL
ncbi:MAG: Glutamyl-Q tRNA(Asp) synthetase [Steroidobacteraceae bacterium]|nr:Glutamyl-Q tRNA(Asp) synthetase [Steroidobacteraceae bacterium]